jgi:hypothetical protein
MKLNVDASVFFPGSQVTTAFGWDPYTFRNRPRIHPAIDRAGKGLVHSPLKAERSAWIDNDAEGCSVLRLFFEGGELRLLHFIRGELDSGALAAAITGAGLEAGAPIGPTGNHGLSVAAGSGDGRHVHYSLVLEPGVYDDDLATKIGSIWNSDYSSSYRDRYKQPFIDEVRARGITWMNAHIIARHDPYYDGKLRLYINPAVYGL